nr:tigger transposable element-derived protein 6-like [Dermacentor andersoni]
MTAQLFEKHSRQLDWRFATQQRNVLVVLNNASAHVNLDDMASIKLLFLPPNTTVLAQPLNEGIIHSVKQIYWKNLLHRMVLAMDSNKTYSIDLLGAIDLLIHSWMQVLPATMQNCFTQAKFVVHEGGSDKVDEDTEHCVSLLAEILEQQGDAAEQVNVETFRDVDDEVVTLPEFSDGNIVADIAPRPASSKSDDDDGDVEVDNCPSLSDVVHALSIM